MRGACRAVVLPHEPAIEKTAMRHVPRFFEHHGKKLTLRSWKEIVQLNLVRHCLQGGFQIQLMYNDTLHGIFWATFEVSGTSLSQLEKRLYMSKTSEALKAADKVMTKQRRMRTNVKNHFLAADGEDIWYRALMSGYFYFYSIAQYSTLRFCTFVREAMSADIASRHPLTIIICLHFRE